MNHIDRRRAIRHGLLAAAGITASTSVLLWQSCRYRTDPGWSPLVLPKGQIKWLQQLADIMLPAAEGVPGGADLGLVEFVDLFLHDCVSEPDDFLLGLEALYSDFVDIHGTESAAGAVQSYFQTIDTNAFPVARTSAQQSYRQLKGWLLMGYLTAEPVMRGRLDYHPVAGYYRGCMPADEATRVYADDNVSG